MTLKKEINTLSRSEILKLNRGLKLACSMFLGNSKVEIRTINKFANQDNMAHYNPYLNRITIYRPMIKDIDSYVRVFIHEWTHSLQKGIKKNYIKLEEKEFPQYDEKIHELKVSDNHFRKLFDEYHDVNKKIHHLESTSVFIDSELNTLRVKRLKLKDQLREILEKAEV